MLLHSDEMLPLLYVLLQKLLVLLKPVNAPLVNASFEDMKREQAAGHGGEGDGEMAQGCRRTGGRGRGQGVHCLGQHPLKRTSCR